jgi:hypothetical protein
MRRVAFVLAGTAVAVVLGLVTLEVLAIVALSLQDRAWVPPSERFRREVNRYIADVTRGGSRCQYVDSLFPHPYLGFVHHDIPPCGIPVNNIGLFGVDFPTERRSDRFVLLVTGGSVAAQFAQIVPGGPKYLEAILNEDYVSPTGKPFLVLNGGDGAWKQPHQAILFVLWSDVLDGVVTLDGFNETGALGGAFRFEYPANNFAVVNPLAREGYGTVITRWLLGRLVGWASENPVTSRSHAAFMAVRAARRMLDSRVRKERDRWTTIDRLFALPPEWDSDKRIRWGFEQYKKYIRTMEAIARDRGIRSAYFIQPAPAVGKRLTPEELAVVGDLSYGLLYRRMVYELLGLQAERVPIFSLLDVFADVETSLYDDSIHLRRNERGESMGYRLMATAIARRLADVWHLRSKR